MGDAGVGDGGVGGAVGDGWVGSAVSVQAHIIHAYSRTHLDGLRVEVAAVAADDERARGHVRAEVLQGVEHRL